MEIIGISYVTKNGKTNYTLEVADDYPSYFQNAETGRYAVGRKGESIYVGSLDCSQLKVGMEIEIIYGRMCTLANGKTYQPIKRIEVLTK